MLEHVTLYLCNQVLGMSLTLPDVFAVASNAQQKQRGSGIKLDLATANGEAITTFGGKRINADKAIGAIEYSQLVILAPIAGDTTPDFLAQHDDLYRKLKLWHSNGCHIMAIGSANFLLAEAGLLDYRMSVSNKFMHQKFQHRYPKIDVRGDRSITESDRIYTCTGLPASSYAITFLLSLLSSKQVAKSVDNVFSPDHTKKLMLHNSLTEQEPVHQDQAIQQIQQWLELHFAEAISLQALAARANISLRSLKRRFKDATNVAPLRYIQKLRMQQGKEYLKHTNKTIAQISHLVGYEDPGHFNRLFKREYQLSPDQWRQQRR